MSLSCYSQRKNADLININFFAYPDFENHDYECGNFDATLSIKFYLWSTLQICVITLKQIMKYCRKRRQFTTPLIFLMSFKVFSILFLSKYLKCYGMQYLTVFTTKICDFVTNAFFVLSAKLLYFKADSRGRSSNFYKFYFSQEIRKNTYCVVFDTCQRNLAQFAQLAKILHCLKL